MRLAILQQSYGRFGGAERLAFSHYAEMKRMGRDITFYYTGAIPLDWQERIEASALRSIPSSIANNPQRFRHLTRFLSEMQQYDKIVIHHHIEPLLAFYLAKLLGPRIVWYSGSVFELPWEEVITGLDYRRLSPTVRSSANGFYGGLLSKVLLSDPLYGATACVGRVVDIRTVREYGKIIANSLFLAKFLQSAYHLPETPRVVYPAADPLLEELASKKRMDEKEDYVLSVGSLIPLKNVGGIIRAAANVHLTKVMVVGEGQEMRSLKDLSAELNVPIEFRGAMSREEDLARAYSGCKFLVQLSLYEPFGLTTLEAGLFSKPAIVTSRGGPPEVVVDGVTGYVVDPTDRQLISSKMNILLENDALRQEMGKRARENVLQKFSLERSATGLLKEVDG